MAGSSSGAGGPGLKQAIRAQEQNSARLLSRGAIVGTGVNRSSSGEPEIVVLAERPLRVASSLGGVPVELKVTGPISSLRLAEPSRKPENPGGGHGGGGGGETGTSPSPTEWFERPVPIGVSTGNAGECSAGTIGARVSDGAGEEYALSNNHVYALENSAEIGSEVLQPGRYDTGCVLDSTKNHLGTLSKFSKIEFGKSGENVIDAAIAATTSLGTSTPSGGYGAPSSTPVAASVGLGVQKFGRTSALTYGTVAAVNGIATVSYQAGTAIFVGQVFVESKKPFIKAGDSGSLLVTDDTGASPVGLLFAGSSSGKFAIANPIGAVLSEFGVSVDGK